MVVVFKIQLFSKSDVKNCAVNTTPWVNLNARICWRQHVSSVWTTLKMLLQQNTASKIICMLLHGVNFQCNNFALKHV